MKLPYWSLIPALWVVNLFIYYVYESQGRSNGFDYHLWIGIAFTFIILITETLFWIFDFA